MSRRLGYLQQQIKVYLTRAYKLKRGALPFATLRNAFIDAGGGKEGDKLDPSFERSLKRALQTLVKRGDVIIVHGEGGQRDPYRYMTVECFAHSTGKTKKVKDTAHARRIVAEFNAKGKEALEKIANHNRRNAKR